jgi:hypothetical protein
MTIRRPLNDAGYAAGCQYNPPPLHVYDTQSEAANWHPLPRPFLRGTPPGPFMVRIPLAAPWGDDPVDPANQTMPRVKTNGMVGRLNFGVTV